ncbi:CactinC_cactus domain-containing protein/Cactin_mid domain-containing protein [Fagus crenata]
MEDLRDDIKMHVDLDSATPMHVEYWKALLVVCDWELGAKVHGKEHQERGLHPSIEEEVRNHLREKTYAELDATQSQIELQMRAGTAKVVEYWEAACLKEIYAKLMLHKQMKEETNQNEEEEAAGSFSPELLHHGDEIEEVIEPEEDRAMLEQKRMAVVMEEGDVVFDSQVYWWHDKYRPRKPKYFSRVHTGYEWNKYNQTHYDHDSPPPKFVQGYKFNIFYPELLDKTKAPIYTLEKDGSNGKTCIIRFLAGPPHEDIASDCEQGMELFS